MSVGSVHYLAFRVILKLSSNYQSWPRIRPEVPEMVFKGFHNALRMGRFETDLIEGQFGATQI